MGKDKRPGTMIYFELLTPLAALSMEERGQLFTAILEYGSVGKEPAFSGMLHMAWLFVKQDIDQDRRKYEVKCEQNRRNANAGQWKNENGCEQPVANACDCSERIQTGANVANTTQPNTTQCVIEGADAPSPKRQKRFIPPTVEEVEAYCEEKGYQVDARKFVDYYTASGWMRGKTKIKDWRACVRTWKQNESGKSKQPRENDKITTPDNWEE